MKISSIFRWLLVAAVIGALAWYKIKVLDKNKVNTSGSPAAAPSGQSKSNPTAVDFVVAQPQNIATPLFATGTLLPNEQLDLKAEMAGRIVEIAFSEGQFVRKGQLLVRLDDAELQAQIKKNQAELQLARDNERRQKQLLDAQAIGEADFDAAKNRILTLTADADFLQAQLTKTKILAPFDGVVGIRQVAPGGYVQPGTVVAPLRQLHPMKMEFSLPERYANDVKAGMTVQFSVEGSPADAPHVAKIELIDPQIDAGTRTLRIRATTSNPNGKLMSGAFARVTFPLAASSKIMVPSQAIVPTSRGKQVYLVKNGKVQPVDVVAGLRTENDLQIESGVQPGDTVITSGLLVLRPGEPVLPKK